MSIPPPDLPPESTPVAPAPGVAPTRWSAGRRTALIIGITAAGLGLIVGAVAGAVGVAQLVTDRVGLIAEGVAPSPTPSPSSTELRDPVTPDDLLEGEPGPLVPAVVTECPDTCFTEDILYRLVPEWELYQDADLTVEVDVLGDYRPQPAAKEVLQSERSWKDEGGEPAACFFTYLPTPIAVELDASMKGVDDRTWYLSSHETPDGYGYISTSARIFPDTAAASAHLAKLTALVNGCESYEIGDAQTYWTADVSLAPALDLPETVAAAGWVEDSPFGRYYVWDLQRANIVVRTTVFTDGLITQEQADTFNETLATTLGLLKPR